MTDAQTLEPAVATPPPILVERRGAVAWLTLNRPGSANTIDVPLARAFREAIETLDADPAVRVLVLAGAGKMFCAGGDLTRFAHEAEDAASYVEGLICDLHAALKRLSTFHAPVIAAVHGAAAGAGLGLALAADLVVVEEGSRFVMAYTAAGLTPDGGSSWALTRAVGHRRALALTLLNRPVEAAEALELGLATEVVPKGRLQARVSALAETLAAGPTGAFVEARRLIRGAGHAGYSDQLDAEAFSIVTAFRTPDGQEGVRAFAERRPPAFRGR
jgi:2-(1,2-epoxy-1,2-dihydrophenyl)acetyl-CoA isomerase